MRRWTCFGIFTVLILRVGSAALGDDLMIPKAAWKRAIGEPLANPGTKGPNDDIIDDGIWQGAPVGGFGAGTFSRTYRGDFARWHIKPGSHKYETIWADQFSVYQKAEGASQGEARVLFTGHPEGDALKAWQWDYPVGAGDYYALYPKSWYDHRWEKFPVRLVVEQFSPVLPDNYKESSYPVAVYRWHAKNPTDKKVTVSIMLTWQNMAGWFRDFSRDFRDANSISNTNRFRREDVRSETLAGRMKGIVFDRVRLEKVSEEWDGQFVIAGLETPGVDISHMTTFRAEGDGSEVWGPFSGEGRLPDNDLNWVSGGEPLAGAIAVTFTLGPGEERTVPMVVAWDLPIVEFGGGRKWFRRHTDFFGTGGTNAWEIARTALLEGAAWSEAIDRWQAPFVNDESKPLWYRGMLFNQNYVIADGGSFWGRPVDGPADAPRVFSFLDLDYLSYSPLDVLFYGSMPVIRFWPELDKGMMRQFADTVPVEDAARTLWTWETLRTGKLAFRTRKARGIVPHDLGHPYEDPFFVINQFNWQDSARWKDVNSKFVLMVFRDFALTGAKDMDFLRYTWPAVREAMELMNTFDTDGDGLPENEGFPDQTYDDWTMLGTSAYCGGLYLGALRASEEIATRLGEEGTAAEYRTLFGRAQKNFIKELWNGEYFRYDEASEYRDNIQSDQLAGQWYANLTGLGDIVPRKMRLSALKKIFDLNVMKFGNGELGAINGLAADGSVIRTNGQVQEVWTGTTFALASEMLAEGMRDEAFKTAWGIYHTAFETKGYWFRTPESWNVDGYFRASMYIRPLAIWAMEMIEKRVD
jgi:non-lysosomal glucosylceramidase